MNAVNIKLHGHLGSAIGEEWSLHVASASEAMNAINVLSKRSFFKYLIENDKKGAKYRVLINGREFLSEEPLSVFNGKEEEIRSIKNSELCLASRNLKTIDVIPILEGASAIGNIIAGIILVIVGIITFPIGGGYLIAAGIGLIAAGITALLMEPPSFEEVRGIQGGGTASYLFSGPQNVVREGGPVPLGYGELLVGSQVLGATYVMSDILATQGALTQ
jgi:predicted phage tail protein